MYILGIESSCDETSIAIIEFEKEKPSSITAVTPVLTAETNPVPNLLINCALKKLAKTVPKEIIIVTKLA